MGEKRRTRANEEVHDIVEDLALYVMEADFSELTEESHLVDGRTSSLTGVQEIERIVKELPLFSQDGDEGKGESKLYPQGIPAAAKAFLIRNRVFLSILVALWMILGVDYSFSVYRIPVIGWIIGALNKPGIDSILRFLTATYNGPMSLGGFIRPDLYGYLVAFAAKPLYILAMTGAVIPSVKRFIKDSRSEITQYKENLSALVSAVKGLPKEVHHIGLALVGSGAALVLSNFLTRNGKFDKGFVPLLLAYVAFMGLKAPVASLLSIGLEKAFNAAAKVVSKGLTGISVKAAIIRSGCILGLCIGLLTGNLGERFNYNFGALMLIAGAATALFIREKTPYGN